MNIGAAVGFVLDARERKHLIQQLQRPETDFLDMPGGVWTWTFKQLPLKSAVEAPTGSAPTLAFLMGIPLIRLRTALPDELCGDWTLGTALGRADGLSLNFMAAAKEDHDRAVMAARKRSLPPKVAPAPPPADAPVQRGRIPTTRLASLDSELTLVTPPGWKAQREPRWKAHVPAVQPAAMALPAPQSGAATVVGRPVPSAPMAWLPGRPGSKRFAQAMEAFKQERMAGTALVLAFLSVNNAMPVAELTRRKAATCEFFRGVHVPGMHHDFENLMRLFMGAFLPRAHRSSCHRVLTLYRLASRNAD